MPAPRTTTVSPAWAGQSAYGNGKEQAFGTLPALTHIFDKDQNDFQLQVTHTRAHTHARAHTNTHTRAHTRAHKQPSNQTTKQRNNETTKHTRAGASTKILSFLLFLFFFLTPQFVASFFYLLYFTTSSTVTRSNITSNITSNSSSSSSTTLRAAEEARQKMSCFWTALRARHQTTLPRTVVAQTRVLPSDPGRLTGAVVVPVSPSTPTICWIFLKTRMPS